jgi:antitoxin CptB
MNINRLRWACRRGMLELDLVLGPFLDNVFPGLDEADQLLFEKLLEAEDQDLFRWFLGNGEPDDPDNKKIVRIILENTGLRADQP